ncbi:MAG: [protein-PII] uridylyltransferase [Actinomycetota bacterium]
MSSSIEDVLAGLQTERARLRREHEEGLGGLALVRAQSDAVDAAVIALWKLLVPVRPGFALVALGGYGRGELSPRSDLDLMVLHAGKAGAEPERLFYALWDAGFTVGHATRTVKECVRLARENIEAETSFLQPRLLAGDRALFDEFATRALDATRKRAGDFVEDVRELMRRRHLTGGSATSQLEPNLKEGAGGLRDLHVLEWFAVVAGTNELLGARDRALLDDGAELLHRVRAHLHYATEHQTDVLLFQHQRPAALFLGYSDGERPAEDLFMRHLFAVTRAVERVVTAVVSDVSARFSRARPARATPGDCFAVEGGRVVILREPDLAREPERALEMFSLGAPPGAAAMRWFDEAQGSSPPIAWSPEVRRAFFALLRTGDPVAMETADHSGLFGRLLPEWDAVRCQPQRNVYHRYTVDAHLFHTVAALRALADDEDQLVRDVWADVSDVDGLLLAGLLHDVGKGGTGDHSEAGERLALVLADRMGIAEPRRGRVAWLVRHHLVLADTASRRDINDENLVVDLASRAEDAQLLRMLFLLTVADGRATGPTAWSPWKAGLVAELFTKALHVMERGELATRDAVDLARLRMGELRGALTRYSAEEVEAHLREMSRAYVLAFPTAVLTRHFALMAGPLGQSEARTHVAATEDAGIYEFTLAACDRPGLFARVSGVLALNGISIVAAQGFTRADGVAVEVFRCVGAFEPAIDSARWERVADDVRRALAGRLSLEARLAEKRRAYGRRVPKGKREGPSVLVDNQASDFLTVVEVHAADRVGLLYDITSVFADLSLDIQVAKIATYAEDVVDVFYVRDSEGQKITDSEYLGEIERALLLRLGDSGP